MESTDAELKKVFIYAFMCCNILEDTSCTAPFVCHMLNAPKHTGCGYYAIHPGMFIAAGGEEIYKCNDLFGLKFVGDVSLRPFKRGPAQP